jgi:hypothetical protein
MLTEGSGGEAVHTDISTSTRSKHPCFVFVGIPV